MFYKGNIFIIGCGAVTQCTIRLLLKNNIIKPSHITVIDPIDKNFVIADLLEQGIRFEINKVTQENFASLLTQYIKAGDICIDLANLMDTHDILKWCQQNNVMYLNTNLNRWPHLEKISLYQLYKLIISLAEFYRNGPTAIISHGANPGLISSFVKHALVDIAQQFPSLHKNSKLNKAMEKALADEHFGLIAHLAKIKVIHISEKDSQSIATSHTLNTFSNTWSAIEFINECIAYTEFAWGTHEYHVPPNAELHDGNIFFKSPGLHSALKSWVPYEEICGMVIPHDETYSIADALSIKNDTSYTYRPTVLFVYDPSFVAKESLKMLSSFHPSYPKKHTIIKHEITEGMEKMGCLLISETFSWWAGSLLSIQESNQLVPHQNSTVMQVAAGVLAALDYIIRHPKQGILFPEQLNHKDVIQIAKPILGTFVSEKVDWNQNQTCRFNQYVIKI